MALDQHNITKILKAADNLTIDLTYPLRPGKKLLVLDLDYTLLDTKLMKSGRLPAKKCAQPGLQKFLESIYEHYDICIWSKTKRDWLEEKLAELGVVGDDSINYKISFVLDRTSIFKVSKRDGKPSNRAVKALKIIWKHFPQFGPQNTAHVDDRRRNFLLNPGEGIKIPSFKVNPALKSQNNHELKRLGWYLVWLASHPDFREVNHKINR